MARLLGIPDLAAFADIMASNPSGLASALAGVMAVASGACETVLVFRCLTAPPAIKVVLWQRPAIPWAGATNSSLPTAISAGYS